MTEPLYLTPNDLPAESRADRLALIIGAVLVLAVLLAAHAVEWAGMRPVPEMWQTTSWG